MKIQNVDVICKYVCKVEHQTDFEKKAFQLNKSSIRGKSRIFLLTSIIIEYLDIFYHSHTHSHMITQHTHVYINTDSHTRAGNSKNNA